MNRRILICGLPGSGKTTYARKLARDLGVPHYDADDVRRLAGDWGFSPEGRVRQALRMRDLCDQHKGLTVASFVCPTLETRAAFGPHLTVFMDTLTHSRFPETDAVFERPADAIVFDSFEHTAPGRILVGYVPQAVMIGRYQPWHEGHRALFLESLKRCGYVNIQVRATPRGPKNPLNPFEVQRRIDEDLRQHYHGCYIVTMCPNVEAVHYGRDVGYAVERLQLPPEIEAISGTAARENGLT